MVLQLHNVGNISAATSTSTQCIRKHPEEAVTQASALQVHSLQLRDEPKAVACPPGDVS